MEGFDGGISEKHDDSVALSRSLSRNILVTNICMVFTSSPSHDHLKKRWSTGDGMWHRIDGFT